MRRVKVLYSKAQKTGFVENFEKFKQRVAREKDIIPSNFEIDQINTALRLYEYAIELGFKDYGDFSNAFFVGFATENEYRDARARNFTTAAAYREATTMGMQNADDYKEAKEKAITSAHEFEKYRSLKEEAKGKYSFDQLFLINGLKRSENGKKFSINDMKALLKRQEQEYFGSSIPVWYDRRLKTEEDFEALLIDNADLKDHGIYDSSKKTYQVSRMLDHRVLVDGANVAFGEGGGDHFAKAKLKNVLSIIKQLKEMRFKNIVVVSDAALKHRIIDMKVMDDIQKEKVDYREAPAGKQADEIILDLARKGECYVVSNDLYRDYRKRDEWVKENIDRVRIPFRMVKGEAKLKIED